MRINRRDTLGDSLSSAVRLSGGSLKILEPLLQKNLTLLPAGWVKKKLLIAEPTYLEPDTLLTVEPTYLEPDTLLTVEPTYLELDTLLTVEPTYLESDTLLTVEPT